MEMICIAKCVAINKKSNAQGFKTLDIGDIVEFTIPIKAAGHMSGRRKTLASYIKVRNTRTGEEGYQSFNEIEKRLENYEFMQLNSKEM